MTTSRIRPGAGLMAGLVLAQLGLVALAVAPQLSARTTGETIRLAVEPVDPIDPFRGAYVRLAYPGIDRLWDDSAGEDGSWDAAAPWDDDLPDGDVYAPLVPAGDLHRVGDWSPVRPDEAPYLACRFNGWEIRCGIESFFVSQERAADLEAELASGNGVAEIKVDARGNAAVVNVVSGER